MHQQGLILETELSHKKMMISDMENNAIMK